VEKAVEILRNDPKVKFEFDGELNPWIALNKKRLKTFEFSKLTDEANILVMPDKTSAGISLGLVKALGGIDIIGNCFFGYEQSVQILNSWMDYNDIYRIAHICASQAYITKERNRLKSLHSED